MAQLAATEILTAVREVVEEAAGSVRIITADTYRPGAHEALNEDAASTQSLVKPRAEVRFASIGPHGARPPEQGSFTLYALELEVAVTRFLGTEHMILDDVRTALRAVAAQDASRLAQALGWPGNLAATAAGAPTGLVSGMLRHTGSEIGDLEMVEGQNGRIVTVHSFTGAAQVQMTPAVVEEPSIASPDGLGVGAELMLDLGTWDGAPITYTAQWLRDGVAIAGATSTAGYTLVGADEGADISCTVTATNLFGATSTTTAAVGPVTA